jgi:adenine-specific DNA-methyltransferase
MLSLGYLGNKSKSVSWIVDKILNETGWDGFKDKVVADFFAGSAQVSFRFRQLQASVLSNDAELFSYVLSDAAIQGVYTDKIAATIKQLNSELEEGKHLTEQGFIFRNYSPQAERKYFTEENARRIDYLRRRIEACESKNFLLASLVLAASRVANCTGVYAAFLKDFKRNAEKALRLEPIHQIDEPPASNSTAFCSDVFNLDIAQNIDVIYFDPPYNHRQYSKYYFPLSIIAKSPEEQEALELRGKTGIPDGCFLSKFSSKNKKRQKQALCQLIEKFPNVKWIFLSFSSDGTLETKKIEKLLRKYGKVTIHRHTQMAYQSSYGGGVVVEYLFCLRR